MSVTPNPYIDLSLWTPPVNNAYSNPAAAAPTPPFGTSLGETDVYAAGTPLIPTGDSASSDPPELVAGKFFDPYSNTPTVHP